MGAHWALFERLRPVRSRAASNTYVSTGACPGRCGGRACALTTMCVTAETRHLDRLGQLSDLQQCAYMKVPLAPQADNRTSTLPRCANRVRPLEQLADQGKRQARGAACYHGEHSLGAVALHVAKCGERRIEPLPRVANVPHVHTAARHLCQGCQPCTVGVCTRLQPSPRGSLLVRVPA